VSSGPRASAPKKLTHKPHYLPHSKVVRLIKEEQRAKGIVPTMPHDIRESQVSQGALQRGVLGTLYDYTLGVLEPLRSLVQEEAKAEPVKLNDFLNYAKGSNFKCFRHGKPCTALSDEKLGGKVVLIGHAHADDEGITAMRKLLGTYVKKTDRVLAEITPSDFRDYPRMRDRLCMGVAPERCIAGDSEESRQRSLATITKFNIAAFKLAEELDPAAAAAISRDYGDIGNMDNRGETRCRAVIRAHMRGLSNQEMRARAPNSLDQYLQAFHEMDAVTIEESGIRDAHFLDVILDNLPDENSTLFVPLGGLHTHHLASTMIEDRAIELYPETSWEEHEAVIRRLYRTT
jgi:hypothetical protein